MIKIGITGGIGSGKSTVCKIFESFGVPVYDSDSRAKNLTNTDQVIKEEIIKIFGDDSYKDNKLNRIYLATHVFNNNENLKKLESIIHPRVQIDFYSWISEQKSHYVIYESAIMFETGIYKIFDKIITVYTSERLRTYRILERDPHRTLEDIENIINSQMPDSDKIEKSNYTIYNDEGGVNHQVERLHEKFLKL